MRNLGLQFEQRAARWLCSRGWQLLARNVRCRRGELDIVALDGDTLVFIEVKARSNPRYTSAAAAVTPTKRKRLIYAAQHYLQCHPEQRLRRCRFDVIAFEPRQSPPGHLIRWIPGAFSAD